LGWEQAIAKYEETLHYKPGFVPAIDGIANAQLRGADRRYEDAIIKADRGQLGKAALDLRRAVELNPQLESARLALASLEGGAPANITASFTKAQSHSTANHWQQAAIGYQAIIGLDRNHLPSRAALLTANQQLTQSKKLTTQAAQQYQEKRLDDAIVLATQALAIWPLNEQAQGWLGQARTQRQRADALLVQALQHKSNQRWDEALASAQQIKAVYPYHPSLKGFEQRIRDDAAKTFVAEGNRLLAVGELDAATNTFRAAFRYAPKNQAAKLGLAEVAHAHGVGAEKEIGRASCRERV